MESRFDEQDKKKLDELTEKTREPRQRSASLEHDDARQPRLAMEDPFNDWGGGDVTNMSPFWEGTARK